VTTPAGAGADLLTAGMLRWFDELAVQGIFTTDTTLVVRSWNRWLEQHTGQMRDDVIGRPLAEVVPDLARRGLDSHYRAALVGEARVLAHSFHRYLIPGRGGEALQSARIAPLHGDGAVIGTVTVIDDVSERVASERELRSQIVTAESARVVAEEAVRVKDEFLATLSHEIRTPLNAVLGWTKILLGRQVDPAMLTRALQVIDRNAVAQTRLIDDMLDMARIMSGKLRLEPQPIDLASIALAAIDVVAPAAAARGVEIVRVFATDAPWMMGDADRVQQIIWNLLSNAVKFTESGGRVSVGISRQGETLVLYVEDTGRGISPDFLPQMFERFRQADSSSSRRHGGLGLGLSLVRQLVELHGGTVSASSEVGVGSRFTVVFPGRTEVTTDDTAMPQSLEPPPGLAGVRVLLIEDDADAREILATALRHFGSVVEEAGSVRAALATLDSTVAAGHPPDVIISDIGMPEEDGYELMAQLASRNPSHGRDIPVIAVTAYGRPQDKRQALDAGFRTHITKPVELDTLAAAVIDVLPKRRARHV
jgi:PAS domain S-box-containing protein